MKNLTLLFTLVLMIPLFAEAKQIKVSVKGMVCGFCAQGIVKKLKAEPAVGKVDVSLEKKMVTIDLKEGQQLADDKIDAILTDSGYNVEKIEREAK